MMFSPVRLANGGGSISSSSSSNSNGNGTGQFAVATTAASPGTPNKLHLPAADEGLIEHEYKSKLHIETIFTVNALTIVMPITGASVATLDYKGDCKFDPV